MVDTSKQNRLPTTYRITSVKKETADVQTFTFEVSLGARPGQFGMIWLPGVDEVPMCIAYDDGKQLKITFFAVGDMTKELAKKKEGDLVGLRGPFGTNYEWKKGQKLALLAGGYGAAPMYFTAHEAVKNGCDVHVFVGARSKDHLLYIDELGSLKGVTLHVATDDGSEGYKGYNVNQLSEMLEGGENFDELLACGPEMMLKAVSGISSDKKIPSQLSLERYMKCGYGLCGNCVVDPLGIRLCIDGPVINNDICVQITDFGKYHRDDVGRKHEF
ncbi:MAG: dihydroorotate dehydrogenase electron transfer subunit [Candidatus Peribacteraceae bacterium]|jgi:dihydroorotate dehydrogenase electron transfer subunit|nr:dihydroorotate dehydrogenase electron transfer subunit [Candidatus Peribacteraceae bacterium]HCI04197.1 dihydroorotate dehydrogenase electron transfer subunit [Candidatus Peribacteria bacterium]|tara:strand:+ start:3551 stop:4369 length:819 start_codon:yes stop_codon:yes gene_type:complete